MLIETFLDMGKALKTYELGKKIFFKHCLLFGEMTINCFSKIKAEIFCGVCLPQSQTNADGHEA